MNTITFDDGSCLIWQDRETLRYEDAGYVVLIWVDYEPGFFRRGRIIHMDTLKNWNHFPQGKDNIISDEKKEQIVAKIRKYFSGRSVMVIP